MGWWLRGSGAPVTVVAGGGAFQGAWVIVSAGVSQWRIAGLAVAPRRALAG
ncbi:MULTISPECIES: hypothetical protein [Streptosporangium]|uniref:Uncharacterized protein n=1 Tax=Streptosporangium brasiliense TaxID=47480 RepID=A0ABT9RHS3_9ACTN|nr:hypothetical protein [Streptosporangium brasiliense]MDP9868401.1 hypothetical protein [Streptosporangium brasiliense]